jgi:hypothetical protein
MKEQQRTAIYLRCRVIDFDAMRRVVDLKAELSGIPAGWRGGDQAMHYFIGKGCYAPEDETRYLAVSAAHITHMLRDTFEDVQAGYFNIPREELERNHIGPQDVHSEAYRAWVKSRVQLAREYFGQGRIYLSRVQNWRCRLAGLEYTEHFEGLLDTIERDGYRLRPRYDERKRLGTSLQMTWLALSSMVKLHGAGTLSHQSPRNG